MYSVEFYDVLHGKIAGFKNISATSFDIYLYVRVLVDLLMQLLCDTHVYMFLKIRAVCQGQHTFICYFGCWSRDEKDMRGDW